MFETQDLLHLLNKRVFLVMSGTRVLGVAAKEPHTKTWVPFSLNGERMFTQLTPVSSRHRAVKAIESSWGVQK